MPSKINNNISAIRINNLRGRMLRQPSKVARREILLVYDLHMDLESVQRLAKQLSHFGNVTVPDLPGFGGMDSFYKIKRKPTIENYCAYLASFIKLRFRHRRLTIVGIGVGGTIATRTLQKYADISSKTNAVVLLGSLMARTDRRTSSLSRWLSKLGYKVLLFPPISLLGGSIIMRGPLLRVTLDLANLQAAPMDKAEIAEEDRLWRGDDLRSHLYVQKELLSLNIDEGRLTIPAFALAVNAPHDFDYATWQEHLKVIFTKVEIAHSRRKVLLPSSKLFEQLPASVKKILRQ